jgi:hypothetical protein
MDKAPAYGAGDSGFESQYGLNSFFRLFLTWFNSFFCLHARGNETKKEIEQKKGVMRESNSRPPAPEAGIIPLDQSPESYHTSPQRLYLNGVTKEKGRAGVEPATYRAATNCSTTELTPQQLSTECWQRD